MVHAGLLSATALALTPCLRGCEGLICPIESNERLMQAAAGCFGDARQHKRSTKLLVGAILKEA
jgi:hypothetical protein